MASFSSTPLMYELRVMVNYLQLAPGSLAPLSSEGDGLTDQNDISTEAWIHLTAHSYRNRQGQWPKNAEFPALVWLW